MKTDSENQAGFSTGGKRDAPPANGQAATLSECISLAEAEWSFDAGQPTKLGDELRAIALTKLTECTSPLACATLGLGVLAAMNSAPAIQAGERHFIAPIPKILGHLRLSDARWDDIQQEVRIKLFVSKLTKSRGQKHAKTVPAKDKYPGLSELPGLIVYADHGNPRGLALLLATRANLSRRRTQTLQVHREEVFFDLLCNDKQKNEIDPKGKKALRASFRKAIEDLSPEQRNLLHLTLAGSLSRQDIAAMLRMHPATLRRKMAVLRKDILEKTQSSITTDFGIAEQSFENLLQFVDQSLAASWAGVL